jgi:hypothetical protein
MIQHYIENTATASIQAVLNTNNVTGWNVYNSDGISNVSYPLFAAVIQPNGESLYKENVIGLYKINLTIVGQADKSTTTKPAFDSVCDSVFDNFMFNGLSGSNAVKILGFFESNPANVEGIDNGWTNSKTFEVVCQRLM